MIITQQLSPHTLQGTLQLQGAFDSVYSLLAQVVEVAKKLPVQHQEEVLHALEEWKMEFSQQCEDRDYAVRALLFLRINILQHVMLNYVSKPIQKVTWLKLFNAIKAIVASLLPPGRDVDHFIAEDERRQQAFKVRYKCDLVAREIFARAEALLPHLQQVLEEGIDRINGQLEGEFNALQQLLLDFNQRRGEQASTLYQKVDALTDKVKALYQKCEQRLNEAKKLSEELKKEQQEKEGILNACEGALKKCCP